MYISRAIETTIFEYSNQFPVLLVIGPRRVGKTTLLQHLASEKRAYVTLDAPDARYLAKTDPVLFMQRYKPPILIDEIQYAPELLPYIKIDVDRRQQKGDYWITGSQVFSLMKSVSEYLSGRAGIVTLLGLSDAEIYGYPSVPFTTDPDRLTKRIQEVPKRAISDVFSRILRGSMPAVYADDAVSSVKYYQAYLDTYLTRDIRELSQVGDEMEFYRFLRIAASFTAQPVIYSDLAALAGITSPTAKKWLSILVSSRIAALVEPYSNNVLKRAVKTPRLYFLDPGLAAHLQGWDSVDGLLDHAASGAIFETYVFSEIYKSYANAGETPPLFYYRDKDKKEIDLLIYKNGTLSPIEIKKSGTPRRDAVKNFDVLAPLEDPERFGGMKELKTKIGTGSVVCMANDLLPIDARSWCVPAWLI